MKGKTTVDRNMKRERIWINKNGQIISHNNERPETNEPIQPVKDETERIDKLENGLEEIKALLKKALEK